jgi:ankyrin repeat protein
VSLLLEKGANKVALMRVSDESVSFAGFNSETFRILSQPFLNPSVLKFLPQEGWTPLMFAAQNGHLEVVRLLLERGANKEAGNKVGAVFLSYQQL